jgi:hypothetical protein
MFISGVNDTDEKLFGGVIDTADEKRKQIDCECLDQHAKKSGEQMESIC